jgi:hypothetical protein
MNTKLARKATRFVVADILAAIRQLIQSEVSNIMGNQYARNAGMR